MTIHLSSRLRCIADFVRQDERVIDVGTDHAYIPIWLLQTHISESVTATDIRKGPLANAAKDAERYGVADRLHLVLCDGLSGCEPDIADTIIIAGMGGETILSILKAAPWALHKRLILQPQTKQHLLRSWLGEHGLTISDATLVYDSGRIYQVWLAQAGEMPECLAIEPILLNKRDPLLRPYAELQIKRILKEIHGLERANSTNQEALEILKRQLDEYMCILRGR